MRPSAEIKYIRQFSTKVRMRRLELRYSQEKLAELIDCHVNHIGRIERSQADPSLSMVYRIACALKVLTKDLLP